MISEERRKEAKRRPIMRRKHRMSTKQNDRYPVKKSVGVLMFVGFMLAGVVTPPSYAEILYKNFEFGPGTATKAKLSWKGAK
jgi:quinol-cytochrome oxidoreductase complex cytochrome b subunit